MAVIEVCQVVEINWLLLVVVYLASLSKMY